MSYLMLRMGGQGEGLRNRYCPHGGVHAAKRVTCQNYSKMTFELGDFILKICRAL